MYQGSALEKISTFVIRIILKSLEMKNITINIKDRIHSAVLSGPSGVGKTETVNLLKEYFGVEKGYTYESQFVFIDASTYKDITQLYGLTGSGSGYVRHGFKNTLMDLLINAIECEEIKELKSLNHTTKEYKEKYIQCLTIA